MIISWIGLGVALALLIYGSMRGDMLIVGLLASLAFGATAVCTLSALGGASPLVYIVPTALIIASTVFRRGFMGHLQQVLHLSVSSWLVVGLAMWGACGSYILPRLLQGQSIALVATRENGVTENPLGPVSGNISQTLYFLVGCLLFFAITILLGDPRRLASMRRGYLSMAGLIALFGFVGLVGKVAGLGDVLAPIRTANYALLTETEEAGFSRIVGTFSEASAFAAASLPALAFTFTYWRHTGSRSALYISVGLLFLNLFSTSTTSIVGLFLLAAPLGMGILLTLCQGKMRLPDAKLIALGVVTLVAVLAIIIVQESALDPYIQAFDQIVLQKSQSSSGQERGYWNGVALQNFVDSFGLGIGLGSSRASSWALAVLSQLGLPGILMLMLIVFDIIRGVDQPSHQTPATDEAVALARGARAAALASIAVASISGANADPGIVFFAGLAVTLSVRRFLRQTDVAPAFKPAYVHVTPWRASVQ